MSYLRSISYFIFFFFNDTATTEIYTLSLHDALPISDGSFSARMPRWTSSVASPPSRSEEHTSELQSPVHLVCRLLLEKKKKIYFYSLTYTKKKKKCTKSYQRHHL